MEFLAPWAGVTAAAIAVPTLLALYLLKLRRRPARVSTIDFWPKADDDLQANVPLRMVKPSWLLFLHLLILALLLLAFARPMVKAQTSATSRVIVLIDRSASMGARDIPAESRPDAPMRTRLDLAKERARALVKDLRRGVAPRQIGVVAFASEPVALSPLSGSSSAAIDAIDSVTQTDEPADLRAALALIEALASPSASEEDAPNDPLTVYIVADGSYSGEMPGPVTGTRIVFERVGPAIAQPAPTPADAASAAPAPAPAPAPAHVGNLAIVGFAARRDYQDPATLRVFVEVLNATGAPATVPIALSFDGVVIDRKALAVPALDENSKPGGRASVVFERTTREGGILVARLGVEDALPADDAASLVVAPAAKPLIALVKPNPAIESADQAQDVASILLADALAEMRARAVLEWRSTDVEALLARNAPQDQWPDLVVFDRVAPSTLPPVNSLHLGAWPDAVASPAIALARRDDSRTSQGVMLWDRDDPILRDVGLDALRISGDAAFVIAPDSRGVRELARTSTGPVIIAVDQAGVRRVATAFALRDSNWPVQASFPIFLANVVESLTMRGEDQAGRAFKAGQAVSIATNPGPGRVVVRGAGLDQADLTATIAPGERSASVGRIERVGIFKVEGDTATPAIAVNLLDATESALDAPAELAVNGRLLPGVSRGTSPREIWPWLLIAATALLTVEWLVFSARARA